VVVLVVVFVCVYRIMYHTTVVSVINDKMISYIHLKLILAKNCGVVCKFIVVYSIQLLLSSLLI
jgi:hypothetical protein